MLFGGDYPYTGPITFVNNGNDPLCCSENILSFSSYALMSGWHVSLFLLSDLQNGNHIVGSLIDSLIHILANNVNM